MNALEYLINEEKEDIERVKARSKFYAFCKADTEYIARLEELLATGCDYEKMALLYAEHFGIYEYSVKGNMMRWISYFGSEGFINVKLNLDTCEEVRKPQATTKKPYNYFCG